MSARRSYRSRLALIMLLLVPTISFADQASLIVMNGQKLPEMCEEGPSFEGAYIGSLMYIIGAIEATEAIERASGQNFAVWCAPQASITSEQAPKIGCNYLEKHPENWSYNASSQITLAMAEAYPCPY